jgi:hypothetical protein
MGLPDDRTAERFVALGQRWSRPVDELHHSFNQSLVQSDEV